MTEVSTEFYPSKIHVATENCKNDVCAYLGSKLCGLNHDALTYLANCSLERGGGRWTTVYTAGECILISIE